MFAIRTKGDSEMDRYEKVKAKIENSDSGKFNEFKEKITNSKAVCIVLLLAFLVIGAFLAYSQSQKTTGKFMAKHFYTIPMESYVIEGFNAETDEITSSTELNKDQVTELAHYIQKADFKKVNEITPTVKEGFIFSGLDEKGEPIFYLKSYGGEFCEGYMVYPDGSRPKNEFKFKIISSDWASTFNNYL